MFKDCATCALLRKEFRIPNAHVMAKTIRLIKASVLDQTIVEVDSNCRFAPDTFASFCDDKTWPDYINNLFQCTACGLQFRLEVETYHGSGGSWEIDPESLAR
jgi:hypothetical protein